MRINIEGTMYSVDSRIEKDLLKTGENGKMPLRASELLDELNKMELLQLYAADTLYPSILKLEIKNFGIFSAVELAFQLSKFLLNGKPEEVNNE